MSAGQDPAPERVGDGGYTVHVHDTTGVQVGDGNTQIIYSYSAATWTDGVAPPPLASISGEVDSPYRGLRAFEEQDAAFFFGREAAAREILQRLSDCLGGKALLVVSGVSGAGKSSLLRAGVLPQIRGAGLAGAAGAAQWPCLVITPTHAPLNELASGVASLAGTDAGSVRDQLAANPAGFALTARQAAAARTDSPTGGPGARQERRLLLIVDQFEQLFTQGADEDQRRAFVAALHAAATTGHGRAQQPAALVVLVVRADSEARCADYPQLVPAVQDRYLVTSMTERQLRLAITEPARKAASSVDDVLVEALLHGTASGAGSLPLLSHALDQAWRSRTGGVLGLADYERIGGIEGGVATSAERAYSALTPGQREAARVIFMRLTATSGDGPDSARRVVRAELTAGMSDADARDVESVLEAFSAERLLTLGAGFVEISHEVLLTAWQQLRDWLDGSQLDRALYGQLITDARSWEASRRDPSYLYRAGRLAEISTAAARWTTAPVRFPPLSPAGEAFLDAARRAARRAIRRRRSVIASLLVLTLAAATAAGVAARNAAYANQQHAIALSRQLAAESLALDSSDPYTARQLAVAAWSVFPTDQAASVMSTLLTEQQQTGSLPVDPAGVGVTAVAFSPDGHLLATAGAAMRLWDTATGRPVGPPLRINDPVAGQPSNREITTGTEVAFSPDGRLLASADSNGYVQLWNAATRKPIGAPMAAGGGLGLGVNGIAFSPDGRLLVSVNEGSYAQLWNTATGKPVDAPVNVQSRTNGHVTGARGVAFSPDGKLFVSADASGYLKLWSTATHKLVGAPMAADPDSPLGAGAVAFSPDGTLLASSDADGYVRLWDTATHKPVGAQIPPPILPMGSRSARTAGYWPAPTPTAMSNSGAPRTARPSAHRYPPILPMASMGWRSARTVHCSPVLTATATYDYGTPPPESPSAPP